MEPDARAVRGPRRGGVPVRGAAIVGVGLLVAQVIAMLQMVLVARLLGPAQYGAFGALAAVLLLGSTVMVATQTVVARHVAAGHAADQVGGRAILAAGAGTSAIAAALSPAIAGALHLPGPGAVLVVAATFIPFAITGAQLGLLQGAEHHARLGLLYAVSTVLRVVGAVAGAAVGRSASTTLVGLALGAAAATVAGRQLLVARPTTARVGTSRAFLAEVALAGHALLALYALTNVDLLLARAQLPAHEAGLYAAGALVARAVFFLPQAVLVTAFPRMVASAGGVQRQAVAGVVTIGLAATLGVAALPGVAIGILAGPQYQSVSAQAWIFALAGSGFAVVQVLLYARLAHDDRRAGLLLWGAVAALSALGLTVGTSVTALAACAAAVAWATALGGAIAARARRPSSSGPTPPATPG